MTPLHTWPDPVTSPGQRAAIFAKLKNPVSGGGNMPAIRDSGSNDDTLTREQYDHMQRWSTGNYANDWVGVPPPQTDITPDGLDRATHFDLWTVAIHSSADHLMAGKPEVFLRTPAIETSRRPAPAGPAPPSTLRIVTRSDRVLPRGSATTCGSSSASSLASFAI